MVFDEQSAGVPGFTSSRGPMRSRISLPKQRWTQVRVWPEAVMGFPGCSAKNMRSFPWLSSTQSSKGFRWKTASRKSDQSTTSNSPSWFARYCA